MPILPPTGGGSGGGSGPSEPITKKITTDYQILPTDDHIISNGGNLITLPLFANAIKPVFISNEGIVDDTIDGNGKIVPNSTSVTSTEVRGFAAGTSEWIEQ